MKYTLLILLMAAGAAAAVAQAPTTPAATPATGTKTTATKPATAKTATSKPAATKAAATKTAASKLPPEQDADRRRPLVAEPAWRQAMVPVREALVERELRPASEQQRQRELVL